MPTASAPRDEACSAWDSFGKRYHTPGDSYDPAWDLAGVMQDLQLAWRAGDALARSRLWPNYHAGTGFRATRDATRPAQDMSDR